MIPTLDDLIAQHLAMTFAGRADCPFDEYLRRSGWRLEEVTPASGGVAWVTAWAPDGGPLVTAPARLSG